ncbi:hypothetical protein Tco_0409728 [Tanacetum coccineum]
MRLRRLVRFLSDFDGKIRYHPGKASVAADALSKNKRAKPLRVRALVMTINSNLPPQIHEARVEALKKENIKDENFHGMDKEFENRLDGTLCIRRRKVFRRRTTSYSVRRDPDDKLHLIEEPIEIMDREVKCLKQSRISIVKVHWNLRRGFKFT